MKYTIHLWKTPAGCLCGSGSSTSQRFHGELWFRRDGQKPQSSVVGGSPRFAWRCRCIHWYDMYNIYIHIQSYCMILCMYVYPHYPPYRLQLISLCQYSYVSWFTICMKTSLRYHEPNISVLTQHGRQPWISLIPNLRWVVLTFSFCCYGT